MEIISIVAIGIVSALASLLIKQYKPEYAMLVQLAGGILIVLLVASKIGDAVNGVMGLFARSDQAGHLKIMLKALGVCLLAQFGADACRDAGEQALAAKIEFGGKVVVLGLALPLFQYIAEMIAQIVGQ